MDIETLLKKPYLSPAGRKTITSKAEGVAYMNTKQAAKILGIHPRSVRTIVSQEWLSPMRSEARYLSFESSKVTSLANLMEQSYQDIQEAARATGQSIHAFRRTWIDTGFIQAQRFAERTIIARKDIKKILSTWKEAATGSVISEQMGRRRYLCINLMKMGRLKPKLVLGSGTHKVYLYSRNDPALYLYQLG